MFTGGSPSRQAAQPYVIAGTLIVIALGIALLAQPSFTPESQYLSISDTCAPISSAGKRALNTMLREAEAEFQRVLSTLNSDTLEAVCDTLRESE